MPVYSYTLAGTPSAYGGGAGSFAGLAHEPDHSGYGLAQLLEQYAESTRLRAILDILLDGEATIGLTTGPTGVQSIEDLAWELYTERHLTTVDGLGPAAGVQLDVLGRLLGEGRRGRLDAEYRVFLSVAILVNRSDGTAPDLLEILDTISGFDHVAIRECWPAFLEVYLAGTDYTENTVRALRDAKPGGVGMHVISSDALWADVFRYSGTTAAEEATTTYGWGSVHDAGIPGGEWASCYARVPA